MKKLSVVSAGAALCLCAASIPSVPLHAQLSKNASVFASGLAGPRGLRFGPDGELYVAEAGFGGTTSTAGQCDQVIPPIGPYTGAFNSRISKIDKSGKRTIVASGFPSSQSSDATKDTAGVADIAFLDGRLFAVLGGAGCSHGIATVPNGIVEVDQRSGHWHIVADLSSYLKSHQAAYENVGDFEPDGTFYSLIAAHGLLYTVEPNHGQVFSVTPWGEIKLVSDISKSEGHIVPTSIAEHHGSFFVGNLGVFPITPDSSRVIELTSRCGERKLAGFDPCEDGKMLAPATSRAGFATILALDVGPDGLLYVLEMSSEAGYPTPGLGKVVRLNCKGVIEDVATGLSVPTGMTFGPDGYLYVSNFGAAPAGAGQILKIRVP